MMATDIRLLGEDDPVLLQLALLFEEMQAHYGVPCPPRADILSGLQEKTPGAEILVAEQNGAVCGFCSFSAVYPGPGLKPGFFLKELYVSSAYRGKGVGHSLMRQLAVLTRRRGLSRIDWTADATNAQLLSFYDDLGGMRKTEKMYYRLDGQALEALGSESS